MKLKDKLTLTQHLKLTYHFLKICIFHEDFFLRFLIVLSLSLLAINSSQGQYFSHLSIPRVYKSKNSNICQRVNNSLNL